MSGPTRALWTVDAHDALLADADKVRGAMARWESLTPAERKAERQARDDEARRQAAEAHAHHRDLMATVDGVAAAVLDLHAPKGDGPGPQWCGGCDPGAYAQEDPDWPCDTYVLVRDMVAT